MISPVASLIVALRLPFTAVEALDAFLGGLAAEEVEHAAEHALELDGWSCRAS